MLWEQCVEVLRAELPQHQTKMWLNLLQVEETENRVNLIAANQFVYNWVSKKFIDKIREVFHRISDAPVEVRLLSESSQVKLDNVVFFGSVENDVLEGVQQATVPAKENKNVVSQGQAYNNLNPAFTFEQFVVGKSNQLAKAAAVQVAENAGGAYNPLCICGGVGLGKTHLMHAVGNFILSRNPHAKIVYLHSERFVGDMVKALQNNTIDAFKAYYRGVDALLIDDIQFFAGKERSQEEFFHTFNALLEARQQVILTCDRYPKEINGLEERLKSRFGSGLTVVVEPPELETRVAILINKAKQMHVVLPEEVAFFIGKRIRSNVRELEGALKRVVANAKFINADINIDFVKEALKDLLAVHDRIISIDNICATVSEYFKVKISDLKSTKRSRSIARPRQIAMTLAKELTNHSLPEIGDAFGGRDHTTVLHAIRTIKDLIQADKELLSDYNNLLRVLSV